MKVLAFIPGLLSLGLGGYLCLMDKSYGWFLALGFILSLCALGSVKPPSDDNPLSRGEYP